jgi:5-methylcytosine-specific restriction endonuclease McrA
MRCCVKCNESKPSAQFHFRDSTHTKRHGQCKSCMAIHQKAYEARNREKINARQRKNHEKYRPKKLAYWKKYSAENKEKIKAKNRKYQQANKDKCCARSMRYYYRNPERAGQWAKLNPAATKVTQRRYRQNNAEKILLKNQKRYALMMGQKGNISVDLSERLMVSQNGLCPYCKIDLKTVEIHRDHIIPLKRGGPHDDKNIQLTCERCNIKKSSRDPILFGREMGIFIPSTQLAI